MEKARWPVLTLSNALPREFADALTIFIIGLVGSARLLQTGDTGIELAQLVPLLSVPPVCMLASLTNTAQKLREELAILAYGGSSRQIAIGYFLRGFTCSIVALSPGLLLAILADKVFLSATTTLLAAVAGGLFYLVPSLRRMQSSEFVEHYKA